MTFNELLSMSGMKLLIVFEKKYPFAPVIDLLDTAPSKYIVFK